MNTTALNGTLFCDFDFCIPWSSFTTELPEIYVEIASLMFLFFFVGILVIIEIKYDENQNNLKSVKNINLLTRKEAVSGNYIEKSKPHKKKQKKK